MGRTATDRTAEHVIETLDLHAPQPADKATDKLLSVCKSLERTLFPQGGGIVRLEPGFATNMGFEQKAVVEVKKKGFRDVLFRAYVPVDGYPVAIDFFGEEAISCATEGDLDREIGKFVRSPEILPRLKQYMSLGRS